ncbi:MAG: hypothetical protein HY098_01540 [Nitrospinae bacterium]|nr:hypothetical protein [Nitrospinota bacterium]
MEETPWGFSEIPPENSQAAQRERSGTSGESAKYPPAERPIFAEPKRQKPTAEEPPRPVSSLSVTSLVLGITALVLAAVFFYRSNLNIRNVENWANQALTAVGELRHTGGPAPTAMKLELTRTLRLLDSMAVEFGSEPDLRNKIETMRNETLDILYSLEEKGPGESAQSAVPQPTPDQPAPQAEKPR